jgi:hypothetical protein
MTSGIVTCGFRGHKWPRGVTCGLGGSQVGSRGRGWSQVVSVDLGEAWLTSGGCGWPWGVGGGLLGSRMALGVVVDLKRGLQVDSVGGCWTLGITGGLRDGGCPWRVRVALKDRGCLCWVAGGLEGLWVALGVAGGLGN